MVRLFDGDGFDGLTKGGNHRKLISGEVYDVYVRVLVGSFNDLDDAEHVTLRLDTLNQSTEIKRREI